MGGKPIYHPPPRFAADGYLYNYLGNAGSSEFHRGIGAESDWAEFSSLTPREICYPWQRMLRFWCCNHG